VVQDIGNTFWGVAKPQKERMPWRKIEEMNQKIEFVLRAMGRCNFRALCAEYGIAAKTGYKWKERFMQRGMEGMEEESRRPHGSPEGLLEWQV